MNWGACLLDWSWSGRSKVANQLLVIKHRVSQGGGSSFLENMRTWKISLARWNNGFSPLSWEEGWFKTIADRKNRQLASKGAKSLLSLALWLFSLPGCECSLHGALLSHGMGAWLSREQMAWSLLCSVEAVGCSGSLGSYLLHSHLLNYILLKNSLTCKRLYIVEIFCFGLPRTPLQYSVWLTKPGVQAFDKCLLRK